MTNQARCGQRWVALPTLSTERLRLRWLTETDVDPRNEPSLRLLEKCGFQREGLMRERWIVGEEIHDTVFLGLLARDRKRP